MNFSISSLFAGLIFGTIGFWILKESRKKGSFYLMGIGLTLMVYPYFTPNAWVDWGAGIALCFLARQLWDH
jgi:hypothetical protein